MRYDKGMISRVSGQVVLYGDKFLVVEAGGVGYKVFVTADTVAQAARARDAVSLWTHLAVRDTGFYLYGFFSYDEVDFFETLIGVSGIGPKSAMGILGMAPLSVLKNAIAGGDTSYLVKVSGIGKKNAEKIVLELKDKVTASGEAGAGAEDMGGDTLVIEALTALGYSTQDARDALRNIPAGANGPQEKIKSALKIIGGRS